jgi:hypothetical protein
VSPDVVRQKYPSREIIPATFTVQALPSTCEVTNPDLFDEMLADDYPDLARDIPLKSVAFFAVLAMLLTIFQKM